MNFIKQILSNYSKNSYGKNLIDSLSNNYVVKIFYVLFFVLMYIGNQHFVEKKIREINKMEEEVEELRTYFITIKNNYMFSKKESEVLKRVKKIGLESSKVPPEKIILNK
tara:strand:- start:3856 stop:4185 length:330 start_codon:yes stop_codon:yes gene_type:complete